MYRLILEEYANLAILNVQHVKLIQLIALVVLKGNFYMRINAGLVVLQELLLPLMNQQNVKHVKLTVLLVKTQQITALHAMKGLFCIIILAWNSVLKIQLFRMGIHASLVKIPVYNVRALHHNVQYATPLLTFLARAVRLSVLVVMSPV
mmetsp:Transcript_9066/g.1331  ORF Transcript_9066/g.1331 Transcript_9066/m.1331 type:complete len:149 (-) Transcript_9066:1712-2158(-)